MALFDAVKRLLGNGGEAPQSGKVYIVDASSIEQDNQKQMSPHQQIGVLKKLAAFAKKEGISVEALLDGKPLKVVADGGDFSGLRVYFTRDKLDMDTLIRKRLKAVRADQVAVITPNQELESDVEASGGQLMSTGTFRKALGGGGRGDRPKSRRRRSGSAPKKGRRGGSGRSSSSKPKAGGGKKKSEQDHVSDLIDLVD